ncbi:MAG: TVP38/TMEM64 family protein [Acholeplasmataceae bacterium]|nr:TVP38/TMEM64 family protein [Acholeplasmataceae bacterium]
MFNKKVFLRRLLIVIIVLLVIIGIILGIYYGFNLDDEFKSAESTKDFLLRYGNYSMVIYVFLHFLQTTIIPISNFPTIIAGMALFDNPLLVFALTTIGVYLGSITSFAFGKLFGKKAVDWVLGQETVDYYLDMAKGREKAAIFTMLLLPSFPDDILCIIAGITKMTWRFFLVTLVLTRTLPTIFMVYFVDKVPGMGWWMIPVVIVYIALFFILGRIFTKKWDKIINFIDKIKSKFKRKPKDSETE